MEKSHLIFVCYSCKILAQDSELLNPILIRVYLQKRESIVAVCNRKNTHYRFILKAY